jgi:hypothetical protein
VLILRVTCFTETREGVDAVFQPDHAFIFARSSLFSKQNELQHGPVRLIDINSDELEVARKT